jgi:hypothetical protein
LGTQLPGAHETGNQGLVRPPFTKARSPRAACVAALLDRVIESCNTLDIDDDSWRQKRK